MSSICSQAWVQKVGDRVAEIKLFMDIMPSDGFDLVHTDLSPRTVTLIIQSNSG